MTKKLDKTSIKFLKIAYVMWVTLDYYCQMLDIDPSDDPLELAKNCKISTDGALTYIRFDVPKISDKFIDLGVSDIKEILNDYLRIVLLPNQTDLEPYRNGKSIHDIIEPIYVDYVYFVDEYMTIQLLYIDNPIAFDYVRKYKI